MRSGQLCVYLAAMPKYNTPGKKSSPKAAAELSSAIAARLGGWHIGVDEAGRGCMAGPVTAAAVLVAPDFNFAAQDGLSGLTDSKKLAENKRDALALAVRSSGLYWGIGQAWPQEIDRVNILNATFRAMSRAVAAALEMARRQNPLLDLSWAEKLPLLIDGPHSIPLPQWQAARKSIFLHSPPRQFPIIKGDSLVPAISAASILAKTHRDKLMRALDKLHPEYAFARHKGYGTKEHMLLLERLGPCRQHRLSFGKDSRESQLSLL